MTRLIAREDFVNVLGNLLLRCIPLTLIINITSSWKQHKSKITTSLLGKEIKYKMFDTSVHFKTYNPVRRIIKSLFTFERLETFSIACLANAEF
jgi:hypothetical protein